MNDGDEPDRTLHTGESLHRRLKIAAALQGRTLREVTDEALAAWLAEREKGK